MEINRSNPLVAVETGMVILSACKGEERHCRNVAIKTSGLRKTVEEWLCEEEISPRLRKRIPGAVIRRHQQVSITIAGCSNGCSRPYVADIGLVGFVQPLVNEEECSLCGSCEQVCPDLAITVKQQPPVFDRKKCLGCFKCKNICRPGAISVSNPGVRIYAGGKLGRHPRFGEVAGEADNSEDVTSLLNLIFSDFFKSAKRGERLTDFWHRNHANQLPPI